jgi:hypothetical protein
VPAAVRLRPDLTSLAVGVNDSLRRRFDLDAAATDVENAVRDLRGTGSDVLLFAFGDPARRSLAMAGVRNRIRAYDTAILSIAERYGCYLVDYWDVAAMDDDVYWHEDRLHLSPAGHEVALQSALSALGLVDESWRTPIMPSDRRPVHHQIGGHARWVGGHLVPWLVRRARGASSANGVEPKHPQWVTVRGD